MAGENTLLCKTYVAGADLTAKQYKFVKLSDANTVVLAEDGERAIGILQNDPYEGEAANVAIEGISKLVVGAAGIATIQAFVASDAHGDGDLVSADKGIYNAIALETGVDNDIISVLIARGTIRA